MTFEDLKNKYPDREPVFSNKLPKPNKEDLDRIIKNYECDFPNSFIEFQLKYCHIVSMGDFAFTGFGWANKELAPYMNLEKVVKDYKEYGFPNYLTPFRQDNGDFWCFDNRTQIENEFPVIIWDHNSNTIEKDKNFQWKNFIEWLDSTMIESD